MNGPIRFRRPTSSREEMLQSMSNPDVFCIGYADADLTPVEVSSTQNIMITGGSGGGKSTCLRVIAQNLAPRTNTVLIAFDPHSMVSSLRGRLTARWWKEEDRIEGFRKCHDLVKRRLEANEKAEEAGTYEDNSSWNIEMGPRVYLIIDEFADMLDLLIYLDKINDRNPEWRSLVRMMGKVLSEGRKVGVYVLTTTIKITNAITQNPLITNGLPTGIMFKPDDSHHAKLGLKITDDKSPEIDPAKWLKPGHGATYQARTRTIPGGIIRFWTPKVKAADLRKSAEDALKLGVKVRTEEWLFNTRNTTHDHRSRRANY